MRYALAAIFVVLLGVTSVVQQQIPAGGPIPDRRGFNNRINDPKAVAEVTVIVRHVAGQVYVVAGAGGNVAVCAGDDGLLLVDDNFTVFYDQIMAVIRQISNKPVRFVVNTHSHLDHVQNNENLAKQGAVVFAHPNTRLALMGRPPQAGGPAAPGRGAAAGNPAGAGRGANVLSPAGWPGVT